MPIDSGKTCLIWGANYDAGVMRMPTTDLHRVDSCRAGGKYTISQVVWEDEITSLPPEEKARLTTWLIDQRLRGAESPEVTREVVDFTRQRPSLPDVQRADRLLRYLAQQSEKVGDEVHLQLSCYVADKITQFGATNVNEDAVLALKRSYAAAAWSESTQYAEIEHLLGYLRSKEWLVAETRTSEIWGNFSASHHVVTVSVGGRSRFQNEAEALLEPTGWPRVDRTIGEARTRLKSASTEEQFQAVGLLCRETFISLAQTVFDSDRHPPLDNVNPSETDAKRMLDSYLATEMAGRSKAIARKHAKASLDLANQLQHRRTAAFREAAQCLEATASVVNIIAILSGVRDPETSTDEP